MYHYYLSFPRCFRHFHYISRPRQHIMGKRQKRNILKIQPIFAFFLDAYIALIFYGILSEKINQGTSRNSVMF